MEDGLFECHHYLDRVPPQVEYHEHEFYEIFFFLSGDVSYIIEGSTYQLRPGDILLTSNEDIHKPEVRAGKPYERYVIWIHPTPSRPFTSWGTTWPPASWTPPTGALSLSAQTAAR